MTMKPKAVKFRLRRPGSAQEDSKGAPSPAPSIPSNAETDAEKEIAAIKAERLSGRQLRMARRVANSHGIEVASDYEAVRLLRARGIDPFTHSNMLEVVVGDKGKDKKAPQEAGLPQPVPQPGPKLPSPNVMNEEQRASEIFKIQRDIAKRRRRKLFGLFTRLTFFVFLPTILTGYYFAAIATPMYGTESQFVIQQANIETNQTTLGGAFTATSQDSSNVQSYLKSREAMLRLDSEYGFKAHFSNPEIDPIQRLAPDASNEDAYDLYRNNIIIGFDHTEGYIRMEIIAADPETSAEFSRALISYAEEQVDQLTQRLREGQMRGARESYEEAEANMRTAQQHVVNLQEQLGVLSTDAEVTSVMNQITTFEVELRKEQLALQEILDNPRPNQTRVDIAERNISRIETIIADLRSEMTESSSDTTSLARISGELVIAQADLETRQQLFAQSLQNLEAARVEANRQVRYVKTTVTPIPPDEATYPRAFENTIVAFLIFSGIYLMISLTAAILREQVSA